MQPNSLLLGASAVLLLFALAPDAEAQRGSRGVRFENLPSPQTNLYPPGMGMGGRTDRARGARPAILLTGYWPPTNEMIRRFSPDPVTNPGGWIGSDWEGRGYDVYAYFPEFPNGVGQGVGDLEVDYQDTSTDFWPIANGHQPIAVITFSRGSADKSWELEMNNRNLQSWINDYTPPYQPTPAPPDASVVAGTVRPSALPVQDVVNAVRAASIPNLQEFIDFGGNGGGFLSEFIAYHGVWYQSLHANPTDPAWCVAAGHVHVGIMVPLGQARQATDQTLRSVMRYVDEVTSPTGGDTEWFCYPNSNSASYGAILTPTGSNSVSRNDLELQVVRTVPSEFGMAFYAASSRSPVTMGEGKLCIGPPLFRLPPPVQSDVDGYAYYPLDFAAPPLAGGAGQITPGTTWHFQYWLRDPGVGNAQFNLSSGLSISFTP